ncbi:MAG: hypothetical protein ACE14M_02245 [Terriglobales bacterium]
MSIADKMLSGPTLPRFIRPKSHALLDYLTTAGFLVLGGLFWGRHNRAAATAVINGFAVLGASMLTDYPGGLGLIPFRTHGKIDIAQMSMAAGMPALLGFGGSSAATPFAAQAVFEALIIATTDWDNTGRGIEELRLRTRRAA